MSRIALIHATMLSIAPVNDAFASLWPQAELVHLLDDSLSRDRAEGKETSGRIFALADYAVSTKADAILYSCSAFGEAISLVQGRMEIPVFKPNEAMFDSAFEKGPNIAMLATFIPSIKSMEKEFYETAPTGISTGTGAAGASVTTTFVKGAREASDSGNQDLHNKLIAGAAASLHGYDAIMLAHFSMSTASELCEEATHIPILTAPDSAVRKIQTYFQD